MSVRSQIQLAEHWPELPLESWNDTRMTLQLWTQIVGKTKLKLAPMQNHWWQVVLYLSARGLTTSPMPYGERTLEIEFDFIAHELVARTNDGTTRSLPLVSQSVAEFYGKYRELLRSIDLDVKIWPRPVEMPEVIPFPLDREHVTYDAEAASRCWRALVQIDRVLKQHRGRFIGKCSPVHFWWGGFDIAHTRFSGRPAPRHPGGIPNLADWVTREAYSHECISVGWWPGGGGTPILEPAFYAYVYPEPLGCPEAVVGPAAASYHPVLREWILPYEAVRRATDRDAMVLEFAQSTYDAAAGLAGWDRAALDRPAKLGS